MLCVRLGISCRDGLSQRSKARVHCRSRLFGSPGVAHLPGSSAHGWLRVRSRQLLLIRVSRRQIFVRSLSGGSMDGDRWIAALLFRPPLMDILPLYILFSLLTPLAFWAAQRWGWRTVLMVSFSTWLIAQTHLRDLLLTAAGNLSFVQLGPFDLLAWQFLWVSGLFIGQRLLGNGPLVVVPHWLRPLLILSVIVFLFWRWISIASGSDPITQTWWFDKWHPDQCAWSTSL